MMQTDDVNMSDKSTLESAHAHINVNSQFTNAQDNNVEIEDSGSESRMENMSITNSDTEWDSSSVEDRHKMGKMVPIFYGVFFCKNHMT